MIFDRALAFVLAHEGEWAQHPADPGGRTRWGLSTRAHPDLDLDTLTPDQRDAVYRERYWRLCGCDRLPPALGMALFDAAVQHGPTQAIRLLQDALGVKRDGILGPKTLGAAAALPTRDVLVRFLAYRAKLYAGLPHAGVFLLGWLRRLFALQAAIHDSQPGGA